MVLLISGNNAETYLGCEKPAPVILMSSVKRVTVEPMSCAANATDAVGDSGVDVSAMPRPVVRDE